MFKEVTAEQKTTNKKLDVNCLGLCLAMWLFLCTEFYFVCYISLAPRSILSSMLHKVSLTTDGISRYQTKS